MEYSIARKDTAGRIRTGCLRNMDEVKRLFQRGSAPAAPERVEQ